MSGAILGVDPGGRQTGVVVVDDRGRLRGRATVRRPAKVRDGRLDVAYLAAVTAEVAAGVAVARGAELAVDVVAVEDVRRPTPQAGARPTNPAGIIAASGVAGAVLAWAAGRGLTVELVAPARHGKAPRQTYPDELREHERSAWDVAHAARAALALTAPNRQARRTP